MRKLDDAAKQDICRMYERGAFTTIHIARTFGISRRTVQYVVKENGLGRSRAEANRLAARLMPKHRIRRRLG